MKIKLLALTFSLINFSYADTAILKYSKGKIDIKNAKGETANISKKGFEILKGSTIKTQKKAMALIEITSKTATKIIKLGELSELKITELTDKNGKTNLDLNLGSVFIKYLKKTKGANDLLDIRSRSVVMGVRGTEFFVVRPIDKKQMNDVWMCVNEGSVEVKKIDGSNTQIVKQGMGIHIKNGDKITPPKAYPWTKKLNWNMDPDKGDLTNNIELESAYRDLLDYDYD